MSNQHYTNRKEAKEIGHQDATFIYLGTTTKFASAPLTQFAVETCNKYYLQALSRQLLPNKRIRICMRMIRPGVTKVDVLKHRHKSRATFGGVARCSSVWDCPVCSSVITEQRRQELQLALMNSIYDAAMITYTLQHKARTPLKLSMSQLHNAYRKLKSGRKAVKLKSDYRWIGSIRSFEVTYGQNGWHPHFHELILSEYLPEKKQRTLQTELRQMWIDQLEKLNAWGNDAALTVVDGKSDRVQEYIAKYGHMPTRPVWDSSAEMTKQPTKRSRTDGGRSPLQLLWDYGDGDKKAGQLWTEYSNAVHGKAQLVWSRGLRELLNLEANQTDDAITAAEEESSDYELLTTLNLEQWKLIRDHDLHATVLAIAAAGDPDELHKFLANYLF